MKRDDFTIYTETTFGSVCSGIEAASVAWNPLGWHASWLAEIEPFPSAVLAYHYPDVPNLGDMTKLPERIRSGEIEAPDVFCGGTPCQAFSVAGLRKSLDDARGNLSLTFCEIANEIDSARHVRGEQPAIVFWENVPGVLNTKDNAFGCFLAGLAGEDDPLVAPGGKWTNAGCVLGPKRAVAWRVLDAQYFGVAQRRRRVFVVASARNGFDPAAVLFEFDGLRRDTAPRRKAGEGATHDAAPCLTSSGRGVGRIGDTRGQDPVVAVPSTTHTLRGEGFDASEDGTGRGTPLVPVAFDTTQITSQANRSNPQPGDPCHPLAAGAHAPAIAFPANLSGTQHASSENLSPALGAANPTAVAIQDVRGTDKAQNGRGWNDEGTAYTLDTHATQGVAYAVALRGREGGATAELGDEVQNCLRASSGGGDKPHVLAYTTREVAQTITSNYGKQVDNSDTALGPNVAIAYTTKLHNTGSNNAGKIFEERTTCLDANSPPPALLTAMQVRRLTPVECERLQGFPDGYTAIPWRKKPADQCPDGPRYKALGNSWAVPVVHWIGMRIQKHIAHPEWAFSMEPA